MFKLAPTVMEKCMSVSLQDTPVFASSTPDVGQGHSRAEHKASQASPAAPSFSGSHAVNVNINFGGHQGGPVFGHHASPPEPHTHGDAWHPDSPVTQSYAHQFKQALANLFGGHRPHRPTASSGNPYPAAPGVSDPVYAAKSPATLSLQLRDNFGAFQDPRMPGQVSATSILAMAEKGWSANPAINENIRLANELLRRPDLMRAFDRNGNGVPDGVMSRHDLNSVIGSNNPFKYTPDKQILSEMLNHFNALNGGRGEEELTFADLKRMAACSQTSNSPQDHVIQLAEEVLKRGDLLKALDNIKSRNHDGRISRSALRTLSR